MDPAASRSREPRSHHRRIDPARQIPGPQSRRLQSSKAKASSSYFSVRQGGPPASKLTDFVDIRISERRVADIRTVTCFRKCWRRALVKMCSNYPESCDRNAFFGSELVS